MYKAFSKHIMLISYPYGIPKRVRTRGVSYLKLPEGRYHWELWDHGISYIYIYISYDHPMEYENYEIFIGFIGFVIWDFEIFIGFVIWMRRLMGLL